MLNTELQFSWTCLVSVCIYLHWNSSAILLLSHVNSFCSSLYLAFVLLTFIRAAISYEVQTLPGHCIPLFPGHLRTMCIPAFLWNSPVTSHCKEWLCTPLLPTLGILTHACFFPLIPLLLSFFRRLWWLIVSFWKSKQAIMSVKNPPLTHIFTESGEVEEPAWAL